MLPLQLTLTTLLTAFLSVSSTNAFTFWFTSAPTQCANMTVQWNGGQAPYTLLLVPTGHVTPEIRTIIQKDIPSGNTVSFTLNFPGQSQFVAIMNDATGVGAGGTSVITTVGSSSDGSCLSTTPASPKFFLFLPSDVGQCSSVDISWQSTAEDPVDVLGLVPGGQSFEIANVTDGSTGLAWTADVRAGTDIMFVAGDKDGLGAGGSSDIVKVGDGDSGCINDQSPSSTASPAAGGVSTAAQGGGGGGGGGGAQSTGTNGGNNPTGTDGGNNPTGTNGGSNPTGTNGGSNPTGTNGGGATGTNGGGSPTGTDGGSNGNGGGTGTGDGGGAGSTGKPGSGGSSNSTFPGSGGGTVTGSPDPNGRHSNIGLILGIVLGLLALLGLLVGGFLLYRRRRRANTYSNLEADSTTRRARPWVAALTRGAHLRGGAGSSVDTLPSMYQTEPFILPSEHQPSHTAYEAAADAPLIQRPTLAARASSTGSRSLFADIPYLSDAFGVSLAGVHGPSSSGSVPVPTTTAASATAAAAAVERKASVGPHGRPPSRTPSGRALPTPGRRMPPPVVTDAPIRVTRDSEDFSPDPEEMSPNPFGDPVVEIPPTYHSLRRTSRPGTGSSEAAGVAQSPPPRPELEGARLNRSNASRHSRRSTRSEVGVLGSHETSEGA